MPPDLQHQAKPAQSRPGPRQRRAGWATLALCAGALLILIFVYRNELAGQTDGTPFLAGAAFGAALTLFTIIAWRQYQLYRRSNNAAGSAELSDPASPVTAPPEPYADATAARTSHQSEWNAALLAHMIIHDLKNPLTALTGFLDLLEMSELSDSQRLLLESAMRSGHNLTGLVEDLLDLARYNEGRLVLHRGDFSLQRLGADCAADLAAWLAYESKTLVLDIPADLPLVYADARLIRRVLLNLLSNALKHTPYGTTIRLRAWRERMAGGGEQTVIEVADNGPGIAPDQIERLFERFQESESHSSRQRSSGLGLSFCKMAIAAHNGAIEVSSIPGDGANFRIRLPGL